MCGLLNFETTFDYVGVERGNWKIFSYLSIKKL